MTTTTDNSAGASAKSYHDSLMNATNVVIYASRSLRGKVHAYHKSNQGLTSHITFLKIMESAVLKEVKEVHTTPAGLEVATQRLMGYQAFTKENYEYVSKLGQKVALQQVHHLQDALEKLFEQIIEVQQFINATKQTQGTLPVVPPAGSASSGVTAASFSDGSVKTPATPLIISLLQTDPTITPRIINLTQALLNKQVPGPALQVNEINQLIKAWRKAVSTFTESFKSDTSLQLAMLVGLIELHAQLEVLYDQLINIEERALVSVTSPLSIS